ncbi:hypothetical protein EUGRSUZ_H02873 [Eucalyptus grandis]|uniref:Uncharacterized protein n=2 Tax=Eucalyptus grandis TaxID=71139 RepID=A0ACC3JSY4_EUCGR|nr:hypothetical protein EUGRSUZ_H02873 [Eucalyptus grandis]
MFRVVTEFMNYSRQTVRVARYIGLGFMIALSHANRFPVIVHYARENLITSERFHGRIHFQREICSGEQ